MAKIPTKLERAQQHAIYAPDGEMRDKALLAWKVEEAKKEQRALAKKIKPVVEHETPFMARMMKAYTHYVRPVYDAGSTWLARNNNGVIAKRFVDYISYGLGNGTSDYIGGKSIIVTPDMVGKKLMVFMAVEGKRYKKDAPDYNQERFINAIREMGGISFLINAEEELEAIQMIKDAMP
jgi:hypothetical protein